MAAAMQTEDKVLERVPTRRKKGSEVFVRHGRPLGFDLLEFWGWSSSDLVGNTARGSLAEFVVARALGISTNGVREEWAPFDLLTPDGVKIEVKSSAYLQSWKQARPSTVQFSIRPARAWDPDTNVLAKEAARSSDVYVFALLRHADKPTLDPLNLDQWCFYVVPTRILNKHLENQSTISLAPLEKLAGSPLAFEELSAAVKTARGVA